MDRKKPYAPRRFTVYDPSQIPKLRQNRLYTRYPFAADAKIITPGSEMPSKVTNISFGGCRLLAGAELEVGATITIKINTESNSFEATAKVVHSDGNVAGVMFDKFSGDSLLVPRKWIDSAKSAPALAPNA